ncbi:MAG: hypothetical protein ABSF46_06425 [Terriglobia bacterium]
MRRPEEQADYRQGKASIDSVFGVLKEQRGMRQFRRPGLEEVSAQLFTQARQIQ